MPTSRALRVLTVNVHKGRTALNRRFMLHELRDAVRGVESDLVFLQEVLGTEGRTNPMNGSHYEFLADRIWTDHAYGRNAVADGHDHGNALLSRYPIVRWFNHDVSLPGDEPRGLLHCEVQPDGADRPLHVVCVHLGLRESHRREQLAMLRLMVEQEVPADAPLVVAGDFNDWRGWTASTCATWPPRTHCRCRPNPGRACSRPSPAHGARCCWRPSSSSTTRWAAGRSRG